VTNTGSDLTYADSATAGASVTINKTGRYFVLLQAQANWNGAAGMWCTLGKNVTAAPGFTSSNLLAYKYEYTNVSQVHPAASAIVYLHSGDVVRPFLSAAPDSSVSRFEVRRVQ
jgi:hypothetical protein